MGYIEEMICWDVRALRTDRMQLVIHEAVFFPAKEKEEAEKSEGSEAGEPIELYP